MEFDINTLRGLSTVLVMIAFLGISLWAYSREKQQDFQEAANLPFADDPGSLDMNLNINKKPKLEVEDGHE